MEADMARYLDGVNNKNVNARLDELYGRRDRMSEMYDRFSANGWSTNHLDTAYNKIVDTINALCEIRRGLKDCLLAGDPEYGFNAV